MPRPRTWDRDAVLDRAVDAFWATGYAATSVRDLLEATGVPPASLYAEFGDKDGLFLAAVERYIEVNRGWYERTLGDGTEGLGSLRRHFGSYAFEGDTRGCLLVNALGERAGIPEEAVERMDAFFGWVRERYEGHLRAAERAGELRAGADPRELAAALLAFDEGLAVAGRLPGERRRLAAGVAAFLRLLER